MSLPTLRQRIWNLCKQSIVNLQLAADKAKVDLPINSETKANCVIRVLERINRPAQLQPAPKYVRDRYKQAHELHFARTNPVPYNDGHYPGPKKFPKVRTANGLTTYCIDMMNWAGGNIKRNNTVGRIVGKIVKTPSGAVFDDRRMIAAAQGKGGADAKGTFIGKPVSLEIKVGKDTPSDEQLAEQIRERAAGGVYEFIHSVEEFLEWYDQFVSS